MPRTERLNAELKAKNRLARGVIPQLAGRNRLENFNRTQLAHYLVRVARRPHLAYGMYGNHYRRIEKRFPSFKSHLATKIKKAETTGKRVRWLDVGPGDAYKFMPFFEKLDPQNRLVKLHTIAPEQILPRKKRTQEGIKLNSLSTGELPVKRQAPNPEYEEWKDRLTHHVGAIETYNPRKFKGKFDVIVSTMGGVFYSRQPVAVAVKVAKLLAKRGKAFLQFNGLFNDIETDLSPIYAAIQKQLGQNFELKPSTPSMQHHIIITRLK